MSINEAQYCAKVRALGLQRGKDLELSDIRETLDNALNALSAEVKNSSEYPFGQKEYTVTMTSGVASLTAIPDIFIGDIETVLHPDIDGSGTSAYLSRLTGGTRADLRQSRNTIFYPYVIENSRLYASLGQGTWPSAEDLLPDSAAVKVVAPSVFTISTVPVQFEDRLIEMGVNLTVGGVSG